MGEITLEVALPLTGNLQPSLLQDEWKGLYHSLSLLIPFLKTSIFHLIGKHELRPLSSPLTGVADPVHTLTFL